MEGNMEYSAGIMSANFWYLETKTTAEYLIEGLNRNDLMELSINDNIYQVDSERRAKRIVGLMYRRLKDFPEELLEYLVNADSNAGKLLVFISIISIDKLFFEFMYEIYREHIILGNYTLKKSDYSGFFMNKANQSEAVANWNETTVKKLISVYRLFMSEAGLLDTSGSEDLITVPFIDYRLRNLLEKDDKYVPYLKAISGEG